MAKHEFQTIANNLLDSLSSTQVSLIAEQGYVGALPKGLDADDREDLKVVIQNTAVCMAAGATRSIQDFKVGDYISAAAVESLSDDDAAALKAVNMGIAPTQDGRLVLVDE